MPLPTRRRGARRPLPGGRCLRVHRTRIRREGGLPGARLGPPRVGGARAASRRALRGGVGRAGVLPPEPSRRGATVARPAVPKAQTEESKAQAQARTGENWTSGSRTQTGSSARDVTQSGMGSVMFPVTRPGTEPPKMQLGVPPAVARRVLPVAQPGSATAPTGAKPPRVASVLLVGAAGALPPGTAAGQPVVPRWTGLKWLPGLPVTRVQPGTAVPAVPAVWGTAVRVAIRVVRRTPGAPRGATVRPATVRAPWRGAPIGAPGLCGRAARRARPERP
jgi:hypothetical protein